MDTFFNMENCIMGNTIRKYYYDTLKAFPDIGSGFQNYTEHDKIESSENKTDTCSAEIQIDDLDKKSLNNKYGDHVVRIEISSKDGLVINGCRSLTDPDDVTRRHLWYPENLRERHTAIQEITRGDGGLKLRRFIPPQINYDLVNPYKTSRKSDVRKSSKAQSKTHIDELSNTNSEIDIDGFTNTRTKLDTDEICNTQSKTITNEFSKTRTETSTDGLFNTRTDTNVVRFSSAPARTHSISQSDDEVEEILSTMDISIEGGEINLGYTEDEFSKTGVQDEELADKNGNEHKIKQTDILHNVTLKSDQSPKDNQHAQYITDGVIYRNDDVRLHIDDSNGKQSETSLQKSKSFSGRSDNPPTAEVLPNIHHIESNDIAICDSDTESQPEVITQTPSTDIVENIQMQQNNKDDSGLEQVVSEKKNETQREADTKWLSWIEIQFQKIAGDDGEISLEEFKEALGVKKSFFAERFFALFDQDGSGSIELTELMDGLQLLTNGDAAQKLKFLFDVYDIDGSGTIDHDELKLVLRSCMEESSLSFGEDNLDALTDVLFESADEDNSGAISFEELKAELEKYPGVLENLTISAAQWLRPPAKSKKKEGISRYLSLTYIQNNIRKVVFLAWYFLMNIGLGIYAGWNYRTSNGFIIVARIGGMNLNFNCMFVCVLMLRKCLTYLRETFVAQILPLDQNILFHKMVGIMIAFWALVHTFAHIGNAIRWDYEDDNLQLWEILFTTKPGLGFVGGSAILTGWLLDIILIIIVICSMPFVRRGGHFQVFYMTHMLYIPFWILCILHGPDFWKWFVAPGVLFIGEKIFRSKLIKLARYGKTYIEEVNLLPSGVCHLVISRPEKFQFQPGDYIFLQIPAIAKQEWHPFTISSAPEMNGYIWLHVRSAGHWTNKLYEYFEDYDIRIAEVKRKHNKAGKNKKIEEITGDSDVDAEKRRSDTVRRLKERSKKVKIQCFIDGPYGTATREIFDTEHAVLVGAGIGVTPMASILQSIMYRYKTSKRICPKCAHIWYGEIPDGLMKLKKVDFVWINRDQKSFEWFVSLLTQLEKDQSEMKVDGSEDNHVIDMHMYMTAAQKKNDMKGLGLQIALDLMHKKDNKDLITGLKTKTEPGRPDWNKIFKKISEQNKGRVKVFFCGSPALGKIIKEYCSKFNFSFSKENF